MTDSTHKKGSDQVPTFSEIGRSNRFDEKSLAIFLMAPHHTRMPDLSLTHSEIADLWAYMKYHKR